MPLPPTLAALGGPAPQPEASVHNLRPGHQINFAVQNVGPPAGLYVTLNDSLVITLLDNAGPHSTVIEYQMLLPDGTFVQGEEQLASAGVASAQSKIIKLPECFLVRVSVVGILAQMQRGQLFCRIALLRAGTSTMLLQQGYIGSGNLISWPISGADTMVTGQGLLRTRTIANPGAGAELSFNVPAGLRLRVMGFQATLVTSGVAGNRVPQLVIDDGANNAIVVAPTSVQVATQTVNYKFAPGVTSAPVAGTVQMVAMAVPSMAAFGWRIRTLTLAIDAGDQWSACSFGTEEWIDL